ncbi:MAG: HD domain-containing protein [Elusimicrobia bacterium]|nr:HD domain-containing protein [Candidatus Obscuribacterium magneticum]
MTPVLISIAVVGFFLGLGFWWLWRGQVRQMVAYKSALEISQKRLDQQVSQTSILMRALPSLQSILMSSKLSETWKVICLEEAQSMVHGQLAVFWKYVENSDDFAIDSIRESGNLSRKELPQASKDVYELKTALKTRLPVIISSPQGSAGESRLSVPFLVSGRPLGVFQFVRKGQDSITQREADLVHLFFRQLALTLENRDMVENREKFYLELVQTLADILDSKDASKEGQTRRARRLAQAIARELELPDEFIYYLEFAALLHDIGKIAIDEQVLKKPGKLTPQEFEIVKKHPELGHKILAPVSLLAPVAPMVLYHQEWFNGKGYPEGLSGEEIPLGARIVAILDAWGAMTCDRPWRKSLTREEAVQEIKRGAGTQFDPKVVDAFLAAIEKDG